MDILLQAALVIVSVTTLILVFMLLNKKNEKEKYTDIFNKMDLLERKHEATEKALRDEFARFREENVGSLRQNREELSASLKALSDSLLKQIADMTLLQKTQLDNLASSNESRLNNMRSTIEEKITKLQSQINADAIQNREELGKSLKSFEENFRLNVKEFNELQKQKFDSLAIQLEKLVQSSEEKLTKMRDTLENRLKMLQDDNTQKLDKIRATVEEKLHDTLEKRLGESFKQVSDRLEQVHKGLGEMQSLATGVGDLKKVLVNVKVRGVLGEIQLENILEQMLSPEQYEKNVAVKPGSSGRVEFAVSMPGRDEKPLWLPIDSKFPIEDFQRLLEAYDKADPEIVEKTSKQVENSIKKCAKDIFDKYIDPPNTTDFAIMFLPFEGLYAEVLRRTGLFELLMRDYKVAVTGPTTLAAFLNSLQMGFRTLTIEKRSSEVWALLGAVKAEFGKFGILLDKTHQKLKQASDTIENASRKSRTIERKLRDVQELSEESQSKHVIDLRAIMEEEQTQ